MVVSVWVWASLGFVSLGNVVAPRILLEEKELRLEKAANKNTRSMITHKTREIISLLEKIPKEEAHRLENEEKREEKIGLAVLKKTIWKKWHNKKDVKVMVEKMPTEMEKVEKKLQSIRLKVAVYWIRKEEE